MKIVKKLIISALVLVFATGVFAGCKGTERSVDERNVWVDGNKVYKDSYAGKEIIKIDFFDTGYGKDWIYEIAKDFVYENDQYALILNADSSLVSSMPTKLETGKNLSDLYFTPHFDWEKYIGQDAILPLDDVFAAKPDGEEGKTIEAKMEKSYIESNRFEHGGATHYYVMPWTKLITGIAYNSELFKRYDIEVPKTMEEFDQVCETIIEKSTAEGKRIAPFVASGRALGYFDFMCMNLWIQRSGLEAVKEFFAFGDVEVFNPAKEPYKGYVSAWKDFAKYFGSDGFSKYCLSGSMAKEVYDAQRDLINGEAAMMINADWLEREMINLVDETGLEMKLMQFPFVSDAKKDKNGEYISVNYGADANFVFIPKKAANSEGAKDFLIFMHKESSLQTFTKVTGAFRPFEYDVESLRSKLSAFSNSVLDINLSCRETYVDYPTGPRRFKATKFVTGHPNLVIINGTSPEDFAAQEYAEAKVRWDKDWAI